MAVGDIISDIVAVLAAATATFQPAAGVEIILTYFGSEVPAADQFYKLDDGTLSVKCFKFGDDAINQNQKMGITNTNYLQLNNANASARDMSYQGIQIG